VPTTAELVEATAACVMVDEAYLEKPVSQVICRDNALSLTQPLHNMGMAIEDIFAGDLDTDMDWLADLDVDTISPAMVDNVFDESTSGRVAVHHDAFYDNSRFAPISGQSSSPNFSDSYHWVPASSSSRQSPASSQQMEEQENQQYIIGQFLPKRTNQLIVPESSALALGQLAEVSIRGKCHFYINNETMLIRRIEFSYRQENDQSV
jgi:hypothetical protein